MDITCTIDNGLFINKLTFKRVLNGDGGFWSSAFEMYQSGKFLGHFYLNEHKLKFLSFDETDNVKYYAIVSR